MNYVDWKSGNETAEINLPPICKVCLHYLLFHASSCLDKEYLKAHSNDFETYLS